nr:hypothetical protein [Candidatus Sigynarchaeota archaeon]
MLFYGQVDTSKQLDEQVFTKLFAEAEGMLIGQGKVIDIDGEEFVIINHEDIISALHVVNVYKHDEKDAIGFLTRLGKAFKNMYQSEIDEFKPDACDITATFGSFSDTLATELKEFYAKKEPKIAEKMVAATPKGTAKPAENKVEKPSNQATARFPGGTIPPEEIDEVLFHEYEGMTNVYNVEMVDGVISKNKVYIYTNVDQYYDIEVDYTDFPQLPKIRLPPGVVDILAMSQKFQSWNPENPPRIVDLINEIEQLIGSLQPVGPSQAERSAQIDKFVERIDSGDVDKKKIKEGKKEASSVLADRLMKKEKKEPAPPVNTDQAQTVPVDTYIIEDQVPILDQIIGQDTQPTRKTSLKDMVTKNKAEATAVAPEEVPTPPVPAEQPRPAKPAKFVIKPRFIVEGEDAEPASPAPKAEPKPAPDVAKPETKAVAEQRITDLDKDLNIASRPRPAGPRNFDIPSVSDLDKFTPVATVKKPEVKAPAVTKAAPAARPQQATPVVKQRSAAEPAKPAQKQTPKTKPQDNGIMGGWDDDGSELEMKKAKEIKDFELPIKKVDEKKESQDETKDE